MPPNFAIRPRRYADQIDAIFDVLKAAEDKGVELDVGKNPNSRYSLLAWSYAEITRLREKCGEKPVERFHRIVPGRRVRGESKPVKTEEEGRE